MLNDPELSDAGLAKLASLPTLAELIVRGGGRFSGPGLAQLRHLQRLVLEGCTIADDALTHFPPDSAVEELELGDMFVNSLDGLGKLEKLQRLKLMYSNVSHRAVKTIGGLKTIRSLRLDCTTVDDDDLRQIAECKQLEELGLGGTPITDAGVKLLAGLKELKALYLNETAVTDAGAVALESLPKLGTLEVSDTRVTEAACERVTKGKEPGQSFLFLYGLPSASNDAPSDASPTPAQD